jgi:hypothetical protein
MKNILITVIVTMIFPFQSLAQEWECSSSGETFAAATDCQSNCSHTRLGECVDSGQSWECSQDKIFYARLDQCQSSCASPIQGDCVESE